MKDKVRKMKVIRFASVLLISAALLLSAGCVGDGPKTEPTATQDKQRFEDIDFSSLELDMQAVVGSMNSKLRFDDTLYPMSADAATSIYKLDGLAEKFEVIGSTGSTAECIGIFKAKDADGAAKIADNIKSYCDTMSGVYASYNVAEADKLASAFIMKNGPYVALCVSPDPAAAKTVYMDCIMSVAYPNG